MDVDLRPITDAVAKLAEDELRTIILVTNEVTMMASGLLSWMEHLADCELNRRAGEDFNLQPPHTAIPPRETTDTIIAATMIRDGFVEHRGKVPRRVITLLDEVVDTLVRTLGDGPMYGSTLR